MCSYHLYFWEPYKPVAFCDNLTWVSLLWSSGTKTSENFTGIPLFLFQRVQKRNAAYKWCLYGVIMLLAPIVAVAGPPCLGRGAEKTSTLSVSPPTLWRFDKWQQRPMWVAGGCRKPDVIQMSTFKRTLAAAESNSFSYTEHLNSRNH